MAGLSRVSKITLTNFNPKVLLAQPETVARMNVGTLIGRASGFVSRKSPDGSQTFTGLAGTFEAYFTDKSTDPIASGVCFLPDAFQKPLLDILSDEVDNDGAVKREAAEAVQFAFNIIVKRAKNPQGYEWLLEPLHDAQAEQPIDFLSDLRSLLPEPVKPAALLNAPKAEPATEASGGKKK